MGHKTRALCPECYDGGVEVNFFEDCIVLYCNHNCGYKETIYYRL